MQNKTTLTRIGKALRKSLLVLGLAFSCINMNAQTVSTASGTGYLGNYSINNAGALFITFVIENTTAAPLALTNVSTQMNPIFTATAGAPSAVRLFYSSTSLSGVLDLTTPAWTQIASGNTTVPAALSVVEVLSGMNFIIPAGAEYRFALELSKGLSFSFSPTPTPNIFSNGGVNLKVGTAQIAAAAVGYAGVSPTAPAGNAGAFFGGSVTLVSTLPCTGTPAPGNTVTSTANVCSGVPFTLSLQNPTTGSGVTYQWQSAPSATGPWTNTTGTAAIYSTSLSTATTYYQALVTCNGVTTASNPVVVNLNPQSACYCTAGATSTAFEKISRVQYSNVNRPSTSTAGYENFLTDTAIVEIGNPTPITVTLAGGFSSDRVMVWIDLNQDGDFTDAGENVYTSANGVGPHTGTITIPVGSLTGYTRMRVRMYDTALGANATPCGTSTYGQVEDYTVRINPCVPVTVNTQPVNRAIQCGQNTTFAIAATGTGITYQWEQRNSATAPWTNLTNSGVYSGATTNTLTVTNATSDMNGYQYRVIYTGACTGTDFSSIVTLTVNPLLALVSPTSANKCAGVGQAFTVLNVPSATTAVFNSTGPLAVPDDNPTGVQGTINVSGIPAGANISEVRITFNMTHTYVGDLDINIIAPNGGNLNLVGALDGGTGSNSTDNFVNTVVSSLGTVVMSGAPAPRTGTYRADARAGYGPTGNVQNTATWAGLLSVPNGAWRLAIADFWAGDVGTVSSWSVTIVYGAPGTGVFTPTTGLFTDATFTTPYTGTPINTVYANPTVTTNYTLVVTTPNCVSSPLTIPYTVNNPIVGTSTTSNASTCVGGNTSFTASAPTSGNTILHQWKVSTDNGATYTNVTDGGVYSGATTATLNISGATAAMNNYRYKDSLYVTACSSFVNTNAATLTVNPNPVISLASAPYTNLYPGLTTTLTASVSPNAAASYTWYLNGVVIPGATSNTYVVDVDHLGSYSVSVNDVNGCSASSSMISIGDSTNDVMFIYPSPNDGQFQVRYHSVAGNAVPRTLTVYDSKGARVFTRTYTIAGPYTSMDVDMSNFSTGIYMVELGDRGGKRIKTGRVVIR